MNPLAVHHDIDRKHSIAISQPLKRDAMLGNGASRGKATYHRASQTLEHCSHSSPLQQQVMVFPGLQRACAPNSWAVWAVWVVPQAAVGEYLCQLRQQP